MQLRKGFTVRRARESDRVSLAGLWADFLTEQADMDDRFAAAEDALERWDNDFAEWISARVHALFVAEDRHDELIGFVSAHLGYPAPIYRPELEAYLDELYVRPDRRRRGVAGELLDAVRGWAVEREARRIRLGVLAANQAASAFWDHAGARPFAATLLIEV